MTEDAADTDIYALKSETLAEVTAPGVSYRPPMPKTYRPRIGVIGTGGISASHLDAYRTAGWDVAAMWNRTRSKAEAKAAEFCPDARIEDDWYAILDSGDIDVVDITLHPEHRAPIIEAALKAKKHVLSQKPFVTDLDIGDHLVALADDQGVKLAINQNGRWAPHMAWMREAVRAGHIGDVLSVHASLHWNHGWTAGTPFDQIDDLILWDFGVHWFDFLASMVGARAESVFATASPTRGQSNMTPLLAQAIVRLNEGQASLVFDGGAPFGPRDTTYIAGSKGSLQSDGPDLGKQIVTLKTGESVAYPNLTGEWFNDGFRGAMGELLCAIEENRDPTNSASENLLSLEMAFAAVQSRMSCREVEIGSVRKLPTR
ncbi:Gfo/Idh/MocA family protein [Ruegeria hyattellae]|uniref:Gfo/Idh/MocA family protein n=1 Tax=Ruegeria hyattellae TaxID=3233337 RepID=UPI00355B5F60